MIEKLRKKLMVLFLTCTMLIFTAAMLVMAGNAVSQIRSAEIQYGNNLADSILEQFSSRTLDFSVYTKSNAMVRLFDGTTTQSSPECFPTPLEVLIERTQFFPCKRKLLRTAPMGKAAQSMPFPGIRRMGITQSIVPFTTARQWCLT